MRRDASQIRENDHFAVSFDTFYDRRNGFAFSSNPVGGRGDFTTTFIKVSSQSETLTLSDGEAVCREHRRNEILLPKGD